MAQNQQPTAEHRMLRIQAEREAAAGREQAQKQAENDALAAEAQGWRDKFDKERADKAATETKAKAEQDKQHLAEADAKAKQEEASLKVTLRAVYPGTQADFDKDWPTLYGEWRRAETIRRAQEVQNKARAEMTRMMRQNA